MKPIGKCFVVISATVLLAACGGESTDAHEAKIEKEAKKHGVDADVTLNKNGDVKKVEIKQGNATIGQNLDLPDDFPNDVALAENWNVLSIAPAPTGGYMVQAMTDEDVDATVEAARAALTKNGWTETAFDQPAPIMTRIGFEKDDRMTTMNLTDTGGEQRSVSLLTMKKPG